MTLWVGEKVSPSVPGFHVDSSIEIRDMILATDYEASYIGETSRAFKTCMSEHKKAVDNTRRQEKAQFSISHLAEHAWIHNHHVNCTSTCILGVESQLHSRLGKEAIHICIQSASLKRDKGCLLDIYDLVIQ